jgi:hypothetical protein
VPVGSVTNIQLTKDFKARVTIHVDSSLTPLHEGTSPRCGCRRSRASPTATSRCRRDRTTSRRCPRRHAAGERDQAKSPTSTSCSTRSTRRPARACRASSRGRPNSTRRGQAVRGVDRILRAVPGGHRPLLLRAGPRPADVHELPRRNRQGRHDDRARKEPLSDLIENANTTFQAIGSAAVAARPGPQTAARSRCARATSTFAELPSTFSALKTLVEASKADDQAADDCCSNACVRSSSRRPRRHELRHAISGPAPTTT